MHLGFGTEMGWDGGWVQFVEISSHAKKCVVSNTFKNCIT